MTQIVPLTRGLVAIVDDEDAERVMARSWCAMAARQKAKRFYAVACSTPDERSEFGTQAMLLHRFILRAPKGSMVDHINRDPLDNRRANLRFCTPRQNNANMGPQTGKYKGVSFHARDGAWRAAIKLDGKYISLGQYKNAEAAARAYDITAAKTFGEFAYLNFPEAL